jgi:DNA-binding CsgD family transcriptional regulator
MPLAIELAAVRLRALSVEQVLDRLEDRYRLLTSGSRVAQPRQQTLRGLMDWSFDLLSPDEQLLWARLSVFAGSFELDAAEQVCRDGAGPGGFLPELVAELVDKSILVPEERAAGAGEPQVRYRLLETIRQYGHDRLAESGAEDQLRLAHRDFYASAVDLAHRGLFGPGQVEGYLRMRAEHPNLRAALEYSVTAPGEALAGLRVATKLHHYWVMSGSFSEGRRWLQRLLAQAPEVPAGDEAAALAVAGRLAVLQGDSDEGRSLVTKAHSLAESAGDGGVAADAAHAEGLAAMFWGDPATGLGLFEEALAGQRAAGDLFGAALALVQLATARSLLGDAEGALAASDECLALSRAHDERWCAALALWTQALAVWRQGDLARASELAAQTLRLKQPFGDRMGMAMCMEVLAWVAAAHGRGDRTARLLGAVHSAWRSIGASLFLHLVDDHERCEARARDMLGRSTFEAAFAEGAALPFDHAVAYALEERRSAGSGRRSAGRVGSGPLSLTRREAEIADLVAKGLSNREIAAALVIAPRTAEGHVEKILSKLGFTSRAQIAAWVAETRARPESLP